MLSSAHETRKRCTGQELYLVFCPAIEQSLDTENVKAIIFTIQHTLCVRLTTTSHELDKFQGIIRDLSQ